MTPSPPSAARVIWILTRAGVRRWTNRLSGLLFRSLRRRRKGGSAPKRTATPRKTRMGGLLPVVFGALFLFGGINLASQLVLNLAEAIDRSSAPRTGQLGVSRYTYDAIVKMETMLAKRPPATQQQAWTRPRREPLSESLDVTFMSEAVRQSRGQGEPDELARRLRETFEDKGSAGFYVVARRHPRPWPSVRFWPAPENAHKMILAVSVVLSLLALAILLLGFGSQNQDLGKVEWSLEWLFTFPASARVLLGAQVLQFTLLNAFSWFVTFPLLFVVFWSAGYRGWALPLGLAATLYVNLILASIRALGETWLRKSLSRARLKNLQAAFTVVGTACFFGALVFVNRRSVPTWAFEGGGPLGAWIAWLPCSMPVLLCRSGPSWWLPVGAMVACGAAVAFTAVRAAAWYLRDGLVRAGGAYQAARRPAAARASKAPSAGFLRGIVGKELRLLIRDRNFFAQTLLVPLFIISFQAFLNPALFRAAAADFRHAAMLAFGVGAYVLMFGGFRVLAAEGNSLWLLYTFPHPLERIMLRKAVLWSAFGLLYTLGVLAVAWARNPAARLSGLPDAIMALVGVFIYAFVAAGIGVMGTDPLEPVVQRKIRPTMMYLYMILASMYAYGLYAPQIWQKLTLVTLCALVAYAIWQKVRDRAAFLLDPTQRPPPRIALSDGLIAVFAFFVIQGIAALLLLQAAPIQFGGRLVVAYLLAGGVVALVTVATFHVRKVPDLFRRLGILRPPGGASYKRAVGVGLAWGAAAIGFGVLYLLLLEWIEPLRALKEQAAQMPELVGPGGLWWLVALALLAAPVFEEFIFRGLVYQGLRRTARPAVAVLASAAIFAVVHPPISVIPVFVLGLAAAMSFRTGRVLLAPIVTHMFYNAAMILASLAM